MTNFPQASQRSSGGRWRTFALVTVSLALTVGGGVSAAYADPAGSPGAGYEYGIGVTDSSLPTSPAVALKGGWNDAETRVSYQQGTGVPTPQNPIALQLAEPFYQGAGWVAPLYYQSGTNSFPGRGSYQYTASYVCAPSQWSLPSDQVTRSGGSMSTSPDPAPSGVFSMATGDAYDGSWICPFLVRANVEVDTFTIAGVEVVHHFVWSAGQFGDGTHLYNRIHNPGSALCNDAAQDNVAAMDGYSTGVCDAYVIPDPTTVASCGTPPAFNPFDVSTYDKFVPMLVFWPTCWFIPKGTFNQTGVVTAMWSDSGMGMLIGDISSVANHLTIAEGCGNLLGSGTTSLGTGMSISTCNWHPVADPLKAVISVAVTIFSSWLLIVWVIKIVLLILGPKVGPTPEGGSPEEEWSVG